MHLALDPFVAGAVVGLVVGLTGSGGGALLTPVLIIFLGVHARTAVASDLVASLVMRPVAGAVHLRSATVRWPVVRLLVVGSVPAALVAGAGSRLVAPGASATGVLSKVIGAALLLTGGLALARRLGGPGRARGGPASSGTAAPLASAAAARRRAVTIAIGVLGGLLVGLTSVGSGTLVLVLLGVCYPELAPAELVGTDLVQAVPLVGAAALGHLLGGSLHVSLTASIVAGGVPGALLGALAARKVPARVLGVVVAGVLVLSGCALVGWLAGSLVAGALGLALAGRAGRRARAGAVALRQPGPRDGAGP